MRSVTLASLLVLAMATLLPAQGVTLTSPANEEAWIIGSTRKITWNANGFNGRLLIEINKVDGGSAGCHLPPGHPYVLAANQEYEWKVGDPLRPDEPNPMPPGRYGIRFYHMDSGGEGSLDGLWSKESYFHLSKYPVRIVENKFPTRTVLSPIEFAMPRPHHRCPLCPEFDLKPLGEIYIKGSTPVRIVLMHEGRQVKELGNFAKGALIPGRLQAQLSQADFNLLKRTQAGFSIAVLDSQGKILSRHQLREIPAPKLNR